MSCTSPSIWAEGSGRPLRALRSRAGRTPVISAVGHEPDVTISDYVADVRASTPSNAAEIVVPDWHDIQDSLDSYGIRADQALRKKLVSLSERLESYRNKRVLTDPAAYIDNRRIELDHVRDRLAAAEERNLSKCRQNFVALTAALDAMSPLRVMSRGYAIAERNDGAVVRSTDMLNAGDSITLRLLDGRADCLVRSVSKTEP